MGLIWWILNTVTVTMGRHHIIVLSRVGMVKKRSVLRCYRDIKELDWNSPVSFHVQVTVPVWSPIDSSSSCCRVLTIMLLGNRSLLSQCYRKGMCQIHHFEIKVLNHFLSLQTPLLNNNKKMKMCQYFTVRAHFLVNLHLGSINVTGEERTASDLNNHCQ